MATCPAPGLAWIIAPKPFIILVHSCAITNDGDAVKRVAGGRDGTMVYRKSRTVALLAAALAPMIVMATPAFAQNTVKLERTRL